MNRITPLFDQLRESALDPDELEAAFDHGRKIGRKEGFQEGYKVGQAEGVLWTCVAFLGLIAVVAIFRTWN